MKPLASVPVNYHKIPLADHESHPPIPATNPQFPFARRSDVNAGRADRSAGARKVRIIVADQHPIVRNGLRSFLLARHPHLAVIAEAGDGLEALAKARRFSADVLLLELEVPKLDGLLVTWMLHSKNPQIRVIVWSSGDPAL